MGRALMGEAAGVMEKGLCGAGACAMGATVENGLGAGS